MFALRSDTDLRTYTDHSEAAAATEMSPPWPVISSPFTYYTRAQRMLEATVMSDEERASREPEKEEHFAQLKL